MPEDDYTLKLTSSWRYDAASIKETFAPVDVLSIGGAGNKCSRIVSGECDTFFTPLRGMSNWDLCGPESLVKGMGGLATDIFNQKLRYHEHSPGIDGLLLGKTPSMRQLMVNRAGPKFLAGLRKALRK